MDGLTWSVYIWTSAGYQLIYIFIHQKWYRKKEKKLMRLRTVDPNWLD